MRRRKFFRTRPIGKAMYTRTISQPLPHQLIPHSSRTDLLSSYLQHDVSTMFLLTAHLPYARPSGAKSLIALFPDDGLISISHLRMASFQAKALGLGCHHSFRLASMLYPTLCGFCIWENTRIHVLDDGRTRRRYSFVRKSRKGFGRYAQIYSRWIRSEKTKSWELQREFISWTRQVI